MSAPCVWSEKTLANRHPRYAAFFARRDRSRSETSTPKARVERDQEEVPPLQDMSGNSRHQQDSAGKVGQMLGDEAGEKSPIILMSRTRGQSSPPPPLPAAPKLSADEALHEVNAKVIQEQEESGLAGEESDTDDTVDIWTLRPAQALEMLCTYVQHILDGPEKRRPKPHTPPSSGGSSKHTSPAQTPEAYEENDRSTPASPAAPGLKPPSDTFTSPGPASPQHPYLQRVPRASRTPIDSPVSHPQSPIPSSHPTSAEKITHIVAQSDALARKFYCKSAPPVTLSDYLARLHKFCPMSVAVYIAAGIYIERLVRRRTSRARRDSFFPLTPVSSNGKSPAQIEEVLNEKPDRQAEEAQGSPLIEVTPKSVHRLLLSALRVAMKALEDGVFPHRRVALVGGVRELELSRLEVSMCFLTDFELIVKLPEMERWVKKVKVISLQAQRAGEKKTSAPVSPT